MSTDEEAFFSGKEAAFELYRVLRDKILQIEPEARIEVKKTQISFFNRRMFASVSFLPVKRAAKRPPVWFTLTFGLVYRLDSPRIDVAVEPYPKRWTHHIMITSTDQLDDELLAWLAEAADTASAKG